MGCTLFQSVIGTFRSHDWGASQNLASSPNCFDDIPFSRMPKNNNKTKHTDGVFARLHLLQLAME